MNIMGLPQVKSLLIIASQLSGYPIPADAQPPPIELLTRVEMAKDVCADNAVAQLTCPVLGFFQFPNFVDGNDGKEHIRILNDEGYTGESVNAITIHELTHWLQYHNWDHPDSRECPRELKREYEAYTASARYEVVYEHKEPPKSIELPGVVCPFNV